MLDNMRLRKIWALYDKRKRTHQALWDTTPLDLSPSGFERLFVDSFYVGSGKTTPLTKDSYQKMEDKYQQLHPGQKKIIEKHYANQA